MGQIRVKARTRVKKETNRGRSGLIAEWELVVVSSSSLVFDRSRNGSEHVEVRRLNIAERVSPQFRPMQFELSVLAAFKNFRMSKQNDGIVYTPEDNHPRLPVAAGAIKFETHSRARNAIHGEGNEYYSGRSFARSESCLA